MKRWILAGLLMVAVTAAAEQEVPPRTMFEVADLQLISHEALPDGTVAHSGPVCAAIVMAWFARHGYPALLPDLNGDGKVDEADTLLLAARFAKEMAVEPDRPALGPRLMDVVARYVSDRYPREFVLKLWDDSFAEEYRAVFGKPFSASDYPLIHVFEHPNAAHSNYTRELLAGEGVILGLGRERSTNTYFVGRSFELEEKADGWPIDVVDTSDDLSLPGVQGHVFPTVMRKGEEHWLVRYAGWSPLEFMLSLSPIRRPRAPVVPGPCPPGAIGYDVVTVSTESGSFRVEECVIRDGDRDLYEYTVTNIDFVFDGCGLCEFFLPNFHGFPTLDQWGPAGWFVNPWGTWSWLAPLGDCGITAGTAGQFGYAVPAPTTDTWQQAAAAACTKPPADGFAIAGGVVTLVPRVKFQTTGPGPGDEVGCPDLIVDNLNACWWFSPRQEVMVEVSATIRNTGTSASEGFWICTNAGGAPTMDYVAGLAPGGATTVSATFNVGSTSAFPIVVTVHADCMHQVAECSEANNQASLTLGRADMCR